MLRATRIVFFVAYVSSFLLGLVLFRRQTLPAAVSSLARPAEDESLVRYRQWLDDLGATRSIISADEVSFGHRNIRTEAQFLRDKIHVSCVVFARKKRKVKAIKDTWGPHCNQITFYASAGRHEKTSDVGVKLINKPTSSWHLLCTVIKEVYTLQMNTN
jgi:hypothetical protein